MLLYQRDMCCWAGCVLGFFVNIVGVKKIVVEIIYFGIILVSIHEILTDSIRLLSRGYFSA